MSPTPREIEVLRRFLECGSIKEAARDLGIARGTAKNHLSELYSRLDVHGVFEAAQQLGWLRLP